MLAVLDQQQRGTAAPPSADPRYRCECSPHEVPVRYILFPPSELTPLLGQPYNRVYDAGFVNGRLELSVQESAQPHLSAVYSISSDSRPTALGSLTRTGRYIGHWSARGCLTILRTSVPFVESGMKLRVWNQRNGWHEETVTLSRGSRQIVASQGASRRSPRTE
jgi:hypothetical protein